MTVINFGPGLSYFSIDVIRDKEKDNLERDLFGFTF